MYFDAQTIYDETHTWQNANDRVAFERAMASGSAEEQKMGQALMTADPATPNVLIANTMTAWRLPPRFGYDRTAPGIMEVIELAGDDNLGHLGDFTATDFSGQRQGSNHASAYPSMPIW